MGRSVSKAILAVLTNIHYYSPCKIIGMDIIKSDKFLPWVIIPGL